MPPATCYVSGGSATSIKFDKGPHLRDSARLLPMRLADTAKIAGEHRSKGDPGIPFEEFSRTMPAWQLARIVEYMVGDVELLRDVLLSLIEFATEHDISLRGTVGGSGWATASEWCGIEAASFPLSRVYEMARAGYKGGLCAVGRMEADTVYRYDRKSAYPASLMLPVPTGPFRGMYGKDAGRMFEKGKPGIYHATVDVPDSLVPPLPISTRGRLIFPWGCVQGAWTHLEIQYALTKGARIKSIDGGVVWAKESAVLSAYAGKCFELRDTLPEWNRKSLGTWLKFLANSLTGKLGQAPETRVVAIGDHAHDFKYRAVGISEHVWSTDVWRIPECGHVQMAATLTARARIELCEQIDHAGQAWCYSDTDSCFSERPLTRGIGEALGDWAFEGEGHDWQCAAPKVYTYNDPKKARDVVHAKGVNVTTKEQWESYVSGEKIAAKGVDTLLVAAGRGNELFVKKTLARGLSEKSREGPWVGARKRAGNLTLAPHVKDLVNLK